MARNDIGDAAFQTATDRCVFEFHFAERTALAGSKNDIHLQNVVDRLSVKDRMRAGGVVAHHAADRRAIGGRSVGSEEKAHRPEMQIQLFLNDTGFDDGPLFLGIHLEHAIEILRHVDDDRVADGLSGQAGARAARKNRHLEVSRDFHRRENVFVSARNDDADRLDFINAGVGAVHQA